MTGELASETPTRWDGFASEYDRWFDRPWGRYAFQVEARAIRRWLPRRPALLVLDAGCGTTASLRLCLRLVL